MHFGRCSRCNEWGDLAFHRCPPTWICRLTDDDEEQSTVYAMTAQGAAQEYAAKLNEGYGSGDYTSQFTILVTSADGSETTWDVQMEYIPEYYATAHKP